MIQSADFYLYLLLLAGVSALGLARVKVMDSAMRILVALMVITTISETSTDIVLRLDMGKEVVYRIFTPVQGCLTTLFFYYGLFKNNNRAVTSAIVLGWAIIGFGNFLIIEKLNLPYLNIIMIECFIIIGLSLHALYSLLLNDDVQNVKVQPVFWVWIIMLFFWCSTFFFWASYKMLYRTSSPYLDTFMFYHEVITYLTYTGIGFIFLYYRKFIKWQQATT